MSTGFGAADSLLVVAYARESRQAARWIRIGTVAQSHGPEWTVWPEMGPMLLDGRSGGGNAGRVLDFLGYVRHSAHAMLNGGDDGRFVTVVRNLRTARLWLLCCGRGTNPDRFPSIVNHQTTLSLWSGVDLAGVDMRPERFRLKVSGGEADPSVGIVVERHGATGEYVVRKRTKKPVCHVLNPETVAAARPPPTNHRPPCLDYTAMLNMARSSQHHNVVRVVHLDVSADPLRPSAPQRFLTSFTRWCAGGHLGPTVRPYYGLDDRADILCGASAGLRFLNQELSVQHLDIKEENIFVDIGANGGLLGVIGDVDGVVYRWSCHPGHVSEAHTPCYGAPFSTCDVRRDQVAFLVTVLTAITDVEWYETCDSEMKKRYGNNFNHKNNAWGFDSPDGEGPTAGIPRHMPDWVDNVYTAYSNAIVKTSMYRAIKPDMGPVVDYLSLLDSKYFHLDAIWDYDQFEGSILRMLRAVRQWWTNTTIKVSRRPRG